MLVCGIDASSSQWCSCISIFCYIHLKLALLLHKQGLVATGVATTVFTKLLQKWQLQMGIAQYKDDATLLKTKGINTTHQHFQMRYITLIYLKGLKSYWLK